ncbi:hypothetical protein CBR_g52364 [Chara braunii]|uniref:Reverse transcriptase domain-containing protein n=1 Tax=Chara braunii TaxID=69332 RepID=A0A388K754_CHABU|nr:hypothetical protein CBR_g52364 [Chara braunii]|eukprot:GBG65773.1 hypothetical protein CBR_g52364 [Chara braunii]
METFLWPKKIVPIINKAWQRNGEMHIKFETALRQRRKELIERVDRLHAESRVFEKFSDIEGDSMFAHSRQIQEMQAELEHMAHIALQITEVEDLFGLPPTDFRKFQDLRDWINPFSILWTTAVQFREKKAAWVAGELKDLDPAEIELEVTTMHHSIIKLLKSFEEMGLKIPQDAADTLQNRIQGFMKNLPILHCLCNKGLRERHWIAMSKIVGFQMHGDVKQSMKMLKKHDIGKYLPALDEISETATKEHTLERMLDSMENDWKDLRFELVPWGETGHAIFKGGPIDEAQTLLDDHLVKTRAMAASPAAEAFGSRISSWEGQLIHVQQVLDSWLACQAKWLDLEPIFGSDDIQRQMPKEWDRFAKVDTVFRKIMSVAEAMPNIKEVIITKRNFLISNLAWCNEELEIIEKGLNSYLEAKRLAFPRFYFLADSELLEIISEARNPLRVQPYIQKCFHGIRQLEFQPNLDITAFVSSDGERLPLDPCGEPPLNPQTAADKGHVDRWLARVGDAMVLSLKVIFTKAIGSYGIRLSLREWLSLWPEQVALCVRLLFWTVEVEECIRTRGDGSEHVAVAVGKDNESSEENGEEEEEEAWQEDEEEEEEEDEEEKERGWHSFCHRADASRAVERCQQAERCQVEPCQPGGALSAGGAMPGGALPACGVLPDGVLLAEGGLSGGVLLAGRALPGGALLAGGALPGGVLLAGGALPGGMLPVGIVLVGGPGGALLASIACQVEQRSCAAAEPCLLREGVVILRVTGRVKVGACSRKTIPDSLRVTGAKGAGGGGGEGGGGGGGGEEGGVGDCGGLGLGGRASGGGGGLAGAAGAGAEGITLHSTWRLRSRMLGLNLLMKRNVRGVEVESESEIAGVVEQEEVEGEPEALAGLKKKQTVEAKEGWRVHIGEEWQEVAKKTDSAVVVTSNDAGNFATAAAPRSEPVGAGPSHAGPYVDRKAVQIPSKYDDKEDVEFWISSMRAYFEVLGTQLETQSVIMGMNVEPVKGGKLHMCIDYRGLNRITRKNAYPLPRIDDLLDAASGCKIFSKIDLKCGYHQIEVDPADQHKIAFKTRDGLYEFTIMPFGLTNAPATFQSFMDKVLREQIGRFVVVYLDDILIFNKSMEEHLKHLKEVLTILKKTQLHLNLEKSEFGKDSVIYLGHKLSAAGLEPEATKVEVICNWPQPGNIRELRSFLGLASCYRKFVPCFSIVVRLLSRLTSKNVPYSWDTACKDAFQALEEALVSYPVLRIADPKLTFVVTTDASQYGIGAVLQQDGGDGLRPLEFYSKRMPNVKVATSTYMRELYALRMTLDHWKHYLLGCHFKVFSDHETLKWIKEQTTLSPMLLR